MNEQRKPSAYEHSRVSIPIERFALGAFAIYVLNLFTIPLGLIVIFSLAFFLAGLKTSQWDYATYFVAVFVVCASVFSVGAIALWSAKSILQVKLTRIIGIGIFLVLLCAVTLRYLLFDYFYILHILIILFCIIVILVRRKQLFEALKS
jgi:hypothetical protein